MTTLSRADHTAGPALVWFRDDLRLADNPALTAAANGRPIIAIYVLDETGGGRPFGGAARWWLARSLRCLAADLARRGVPLLLRRGAAGAIIPDLMREAGAGAVHWNRRYAQAGIAVDSAIKAGLSAAGVAVTSHQANLLHEPWTVRTKSGEPFKVFTPFWRAANALPPARLPLPVPAGLHGVPTDLASDPLESWGLEPTAPDWAGGLRATWGPGEAGAEARLAAFVEDGLGAYADRRDRPDLDSTSRLSPHLHFGEISPFQVRHAVETAAEGLTGRPVGRGHADKFLAEIGWREFAYHLAYHWPDLATANFQPRFDAFRWAPDRARLAAWQRGRTGYPIVDAGLRQLWTTGWMHNRVRMVVGSFLVKHLLQDWRDGEAWFWDTLVDADAAVNAASWQWVAGSGADAAPYFRIFNPVLQGERFDAGGDYVRTFVPELAALPAEWIHKPWAAPPSVLARAGVRLGQTYPRPLVDHAEARDRALAAFDHLKQTADAA